MGTYLQFIICWKKVEEEDSKKTLIIAHLWHMEEVQSRAAGKSIEAVVITVYGTAVERRI